MSDETKDCPYCGETIKAIAIKCRYCQSSIEIEEALTKSDSIASKISDKFGEYEEDDYSLEDYSLDENESSFFKLPWLFFIGIISSLLFVIFMNRMGGEALRYIVFYYLLPSTIMAYLGQHFGRIFRDWIKPDFLIHGSVGDAVRSRIFWKIGPQIIGVGCGYLAIPTFFIFLAMAR